MWGYIFLILTICVLFQADTPEVTFHHGVVAVNSRGEAYPSACEVNDERVYYLLLSSKDIAEAGAALAMAGRTINGYRAVWLDETHFFDDRMTPEFQHFVLNHECAHHELGHTDHEINVAFDDKGHDWEPDADCKAAKRLIERGYGRREFEIIFDQMDDWELMHDVSVNTAVTEYNQTAYKPLDERVSDVKQCIGWDDGFGRTAGR